MGEGVRRPRPLAAALAGIRIAAPNCVPITPPLPPLLGPLRRRGKQGGQKPSDKPPTYGPISLSGPFFVLSSAPLFPHLLTPPQCPSDLALHSHQVMSQQLIKRHECVCF